jgi:hypothetical protein
MYTECHVRYEGGDTDRVKLQSHDANCLSKERKISGKRTEHGVLSGHLPSTTLRGIVCMPLCKVLARVPSVDSKASLHVHNVLPSNVHGPKQSAHSCALLINAYQCRNDALRQLDMPENWVEETGVPPSSALLALISGLAEPANTPAMPHFPQVLHRAWTLFFLCLCVLHLELVLRPVALPAQR